MILNNKDFITLVEFARIQGVSRRAVYNWLSAGIAPRHERIMGHVLFYREEAKEFRPPWKKSPASRKPGKPQSPPGKRFM
jgi:predicted DNA-binding transcriptional regulator AlpA